MTQTGIPAGATSADFAGRAPSQTWEAVVLPDHPQCLIWAWYKPAHAPHGLILRIPEETYRQHPHPERLSLRHLLLAAGIDPAAVATWQIYGYAYDALHGASPLLDQGVPAPPAGVDPNILVSLHAAPVAAGWMNPAVAMHPPAAAGIPGQFNQNPPPGGPAENLSVAELFDRIETDWHATLQVEKDLVRMRKQLVDLSNRLKSLNRDLSPQERVHSDTQDKKDWQDARRWLRDASTMLSVSIREHDIGDTSAAGQRKWFEQIYQQYVLPRQPFDGLLQAQRDFETYRKAVQKLFSSMNGVHQNASLNGERRAQQVLSRIQAKVREAMTRKNMLGIMLD